MFIVVSYDIPDDRRRMKLFKLLKDYGRHTQYSVFECDLRPQQFAELRRRIRELVDARQDHVRFYSLCAADVRSIRHIGGGAPAVDPQFYLL
ncbi:MAG TPA: CRISPR-associated endonuclease Cas2 [Chloroflexi bacterium]|nr:CRISPR-associated endonuclease Cas2 [Chloroflexota bacterium]